MKRNHIISNLLAAFAVLVAFASIFALCMARNASPIMVGQPEAASIRVEEMLTAACQGDYEAVSGMLYENPDLGSYPEERNSAEDLLWIAYQKSLEFEILGDCYPGASGVTVDVRIRALDVNKTVNDLGERTQKILAERIEQAEDVAEIYDESNDYHPEMIMEILQEATKESLQEGMFCREQTIALNLIFAKGEWWIVPNEELLNILSGSVSD